MQALLEIKKGEHPYKSAISEWFCDEDGPLCIRMISKKMEDGQIEMVVYSLRKDGLKRVIQDITFSEKDFDQIMECLEETFQQFFSGFSLLVENIDVAGQSNCYVEKNNKWNIFKLKTINWISCQAHAIKTKFEGDK